MLREMKDDKAIVNNTMLEDDNVVEGKCERNTKTVKYIDETHDR